MSSKLHGLVWEGCGPSGMTLSRIAVLARLADYSNDEGYSWPAVDTIREQVGAKSKTTIRAAIKELEGAGWLSVKERTSGGRNISNAYQIDVEKLEQAAEAARKKKRRVSKTDPSKIDPSNSDASKIEGSNNVTSGGQNLVGEGSTIDPDPLIDPKTDPSDKKTVGRPALPADEQQSEGSLKIDYGEVLTAYHEILPEMPKVLELTDDRRGKLRSLWKKFEFSQNRWTAYLRFIAKNCRWMLENRPDSASGKTWRKKNFDYLITEKCYIAVKEERANDLPKVAQVNRLCATDPQWRFESVRRTADVIEDSIQETMLEYVDRPLDRENADDIIGTINAYMRQLVGLGAIFGGRAWLDEELNTAESLAAGVLYINYDFGPKSPTELISLRVRVNNNYALEEMLSA